MYYLLSKKIKQKLCLCGLIIILNITAKGQITVHDFAELRVKSKKIELPYIADISTYHVNNETLIDVNSILPKMTFDSLVAYSTYQIIGHRNINDSITYFIFRSQLISRKDSSIYFNDLVIATVNMNTSRITSHHPLASAYFNEKTLNYLSVIWSDSLTSEYGYRFGSKPFNDYDTFYRNRFIQFTIEQDGRLVAYTPPQNYYNFSFFNKSFSRIDSLHFSNELLSDIPNYVPLDPQYIRDKDIISLKIHQSQSDFTIFPYAIGKIVQEDGYTFYVIGYYLSSGTGSLLRIDRITYHDKRGFVGNMNIGEYFCNSSKKMFIKKFTLNKEYCYITEDKKTKKQKNINIQMGLTSCIRSVITY